MPTKHANHPRWNDSKIVSDHGYTKLRVGKRHPLADPNGYAYEHLVVWCAAGNQRPSGGFVLHHKNENKSDNRIENLELKKRYDHGVQHHSALSDGQVKAIRETYANGEADMPRLADRFSIPVQRVSKIIRGTTRAAAGGPIFPNDKRGIANKARAGAMLDGREHRAWPEVKR